MLIDPNIKTVVFDADDTLFTVYPSVSANYKLILSQFGIDIPEDQISTALRQQWTALKDEYLNTKGNFITSTQRETKFWMNYAACVVVACCSPNLIEDSKIDEIVASLYRHFATGISRKLLPGVKELLSNLTSCNYQIGVFTNNDDRVIQVLKELEVKERFTFIEYAGSIGFKKPSISVFKILEQRYNLTPSQTLHVGNTDVLDIEPAIKAGWHAMHISDLLSSL